MELILTIEAQNATETGFSEIFREVNQKLSFITDSKAGLEDINNYGMEFRMISIIPTCVDDSVWGALGWKERVKVWRKKGEADIRLRMDYNRFVNETIYNKRLMFIEAIVTSIRIIQEKSRGDFKGDRLVSDSLAALNVQESQLGGQGDGSVVPSESE